MRRDTVAAKLWAEFVGTAILILLGDGVVANTLFGSRLGSPEAAPFSGYNWNTITLGWGFAVVMAVYVAGGITGAHINPAVTAAAMARGTLDLTTGVLYWVVQVAGGFVGGFLVWVLYKADFDGQGWKNVFYTAPGIHYGDATFNQYFSEFIGTFMLVLLIYAIVDNVRNVGPGANLWPFMVGMGVLPVGLSLGVPTGYAINPARDFGQRLFSGIFL
ncbi:MAG TPA: MIP/aquaporin family protein, partial [Thermomicrobiales bacterium]|nr:MIP/aquaporin family protein [Thermomicrobiales bacterium]